VTDPRFSPEPWSDPAARGASPSDPYRGRHSGNGVPGNGGNGVADPRASVADVDALVANLERVVRGKRDVLRLVVTCLLAEGHLLIEDVPGTGKTTIARALAASVHGMWRRIQFTPDLLPSDVTGTEVVDLQTNEFAFRRGPVFANIVLADEINRASPKTQSALLEVMEEHRVSYGGTSYGVPRPFLVIATQNPIEMSGTYRLPEAQLDRFLMRIDVGYPDPESEVEVLGDGYDSAAVDALPAVVDTARLASLIAAAGAVKVHDALKRYVVDLATATRPSPDPARRSEVQLGVSTRGCKALVRAAKAAALVAHRDHVLPEDIKALAVPVLAHRIVLDAEAAMKGRKPVDVVREVADAVPVPRVTRA
jgi:MoxR-like ATPase